MSNLANRGKSTTNKDTSIAIPAHLWITGGAGGVHGPFSAAAAFAMLVGERTRVRKVPIVLRLPFIAARMSGRAHGGLSLRCPPGFDVPREFLRSGAGASIAISPGNRPI